MKQSNGKKGSGTGTLKATPKKKVNTIECGWKSATGAVQCEFKIAGAVTSGHAFLVSIVINTDNLGAQCRGKQCDCTRSDVRLVEFIDVGEKTVDFTDTLTLLASGCGCSVSTEVNMFLISTDSPLYSEILGRLQRRRITKPLGSGGNYVPPNTIGNARAIRTLDADASYFGPVALAELLDLLLDAALAEATFKCGDSWNCCGGEKPEISWLSVSGDPHLPLPVGERR